MQRIVQNFWLGGQEDADALVGRNPENITAILNVRGPDAYHPPGREHELVFASPRMVSVRARAPGGWR